MTTAVNPNTQVRLYTQTVTNTPNAPSYHANSIGTLIGGTSALQVTGNLTNSKDQYDYYNFTAQTSGNTQLTVGIGNVRLQVLTTGGRVIADNEGTAAQQSAFQSLTKGTYDLNSGKYVIKVARASGVSENTPSTYSLELTQGSYTKDYRTTAQEASASSSVSTETASTIAASGIYSSLLSSEESSGSVIGSISSLGL